MLLFKNGLRKLLKDYVQFGIYLVLITIAVIFTSSFGIVSSNLIRTNNEINRNYEKFDYSFRYTSSSYKANDTQTFTPWFAFNTKLIEDKNGNHFPTLTFGENGVLKSYEFTSIEKANCSSQSWGCYNSSIFYFNNQNDPHLNFHFGDVESNYGFDDSVKRGRIYPTDDQAITNYSEKNKINTVKKGEFGDFYRFNLKSPVPEFEKSLIGQIYVKYDYFESEDLSLEAKKAALDIFDYMFYLNNSWLTYEIKSDLISKYLDNNKEEKYIYEYLEKGVGKIDENEEYKFLDHEMKNDNWKNDSQSFNIIKNNASFLMKEYDAYNIFKNSLDINGYLIANNKITQGNWFNTYTNLLGDLTNFKVRTTSEAVKWDTSGKKYRYVSAFYNEQEIGTDRYKTYFYNEDIFHFYQKTNSSDSLTENSFIVSSGYAKYNNMKLGGNYKIFSDSDTTFKMDGTGVDSLNVYPTIYEEDLLTNQEKEAIFYINNAAFNKEFNVIGNEKSYQDVSRTYLTYSKKDKTNIKKDMNIFNTYFADNILKLGEVQENIAQNVYDSKTSRATIESYDDTALLNMRSSLFPGVVSGFLALAVLFCIVFMLSLAFVVYNIFRKVLISQRSQIGNLKSLGVSNIKIIFNYMLYMAFPVIILVPVGWTISIFLQGTLMGIFERYFNIPSIMNVDWKLLLIEWASLTFIVSGMVFIIAHMTVKQSPLKLLSPSRSNKPNIFLLKQLNKIKIKNFTSRLRLVIISSAIKDMMIFFIILLFSSSVITIASVAPNTMKNMSKEYYRNIHYNNDFNYSGFVANNPMTRYSFYELDEKNKVEYNLNSSLFNVFIKDSKNDYKNLLDADSWNKDNAQTDFRNSFEDVMITNLLTFKGGLISVGVMDALKEVAGNIDKESQKLVNSKFNNFSCQVLPELFGQSTVEGSNDYKSCIKDISNNILPSTIKELWDKDEREFENFSFNFSNISVDSKLDQMYTKFNGIIDGYNKINISAYGIDLENDLENLFIKNKNLIKYDENSDYIPVLINKKDQIEGMKIGDTFNINTSQNMLSVMGSDGNLNTIDTDDWLFEGEEIQNMDLDKFTYSIKNNIYYKDANGDYKNFKNMADIKLKISSQFIDSDLFNEVNNEYKNYSGKKNIFEEKDGYYILNPFDIYRYNEDGQREEILEQTLLNGTNSWFNIALNKGLLANKLVDISSYKKLKVVGVEELYDGNKIYMDQLYANKLIGIKSNFDSRKVFEGGGSVNIWSNAKMSSNPQNADQMQRIILSSFNSNNSTEGFSKYMDQAIGYTDYIQMKKMAMENLITSVISISVIFVSLSMITAIIIIYLITDMFIGRYKRFMSYMRIQGYSMKEINSILIWVFLPVAIAAVFVGILLVWSLIMFLLPQVLISIDIAVPMIMGWTIMPLIFVGGISIFLLGYFIIMMSIKRVKLASLIGNE